jgi:hypothetical protein
MALSAYLAQRLALWITGSAMPSAPSIVYVSLHAANGTELTGNGYARLALDSWGAVTEGDDEMTVSNDEMEIGSAASGSPWTQATQYRFNDASSGGNALSSLTALTASRTVTVGGVPVAPAGSFTFSMSTLVLSEYFATQVCEWISNAAAFPSAPASIWVGYHAAGGAELSGSGYARAEIETWTAPAINSGAYETSNTAVVQSGEATSTWTASATAIYYDAVTAGNAITVGRTFVSTVPDGGFNLHQAGQCVIRFPYAA